MRFKTLNKNDFEVIFKNNYKKLNDEYISKYLLYRKLFTEYLIKKCELKYFDNKIEESNLNFVSIKENEMDVYQYFSSNELKYLYIRNDIYIEKLDEEEQKFLNNKIKSQKFELDEETINFIENTYKKAICDNEKYANFYGPANSNYIVKNNSIVIGYRYNEFAETGLSDEEWDKLNDEQFEYISSVIDELELKINQIENMSVSIIKYNDFSVEPRKTKKKEIEDKEEER